MGNRKIFLKGHQTFHSAPVSPHHRLSCPRGATGQWAPAASDGWRRARPGSLVLTACDFKQHFVIETQSEFGHPWQHHFELDGSHYFAAQDAATGAHLRTKGHRAIRHTGRISYELGEKSAVTEHTLLELKRSNSIFECDFRALQ